MSDDDTADALGIERETVVRKVTVAMPKGGYARARVITRKVTLAALPKSRLTDDGEIAPRDLRRK